MMKHLGELALFCLISVLPASAATYYIAPGGSDGAAGSQAAPWATFTHAAAIVAAGDTVLVQPGFYDDGQTIPLRSGGTSNSPITFRANGAVTNAEWTSLEAAWIVVDGFVSKGCGYLFRAGAAHCTVTNCSAINIGSGGGLAFFDGPTSGNPVPEACAQYCTIINCVCDTVTNGAFVSLQGVGHLVQGCTFANGYSSDVIRAFGSNSIVRSCVFTNIGEQAGWGNHPDITQTWGAAGQWLVGFIFERNLVVNCPVQLMQYEQMGSAQLPTVNTPWTNSALWGVIFRNNVFMDSTMQCSIDIPNVRLYNNTFVRCSNGTSLLGFAFYDPTWSLFRGSAYGGAVVNNAFIDCSGTYSSTPSGPQQGPMTITNSGGGGRTGSGYAELIFGDGRFTVWGTYTNLSGPVSNGVLYIAGSGDAYRSAERRV